MMRYSLIYIVCFLVAFGAFSQKYIDTNDPKSEEIKSLLSKQNELNAFGGTDLKVGELKGERGMLVGAYGGFLINRRYLFGLAGYGLVTNLAFDGVVPGREGIKRLHLHGGYGGLVIGGTIAHKELMHISIPIVLGAGALEIDDRNFFPSNPADSDFTVENSVFFVAEPAIQLEFNITSFFRLATGVSYRYISGLELQNVEDEEVTGMTGTISFRFGRF